LGLRQKQQKNEASQAPHQLQLELQKQQQHHPQIPKLLLLMKTLLLPRQELLMMNLLRPKQKHLRKCLMLPMKQRHLQILLQNPKQNSRLRQIQLLQQRVHPTHQVQGPELMLLPSCWLVQVLSQSPLLQMIPNHQLPKQGLEQVRQKQLPSCC